MPVAPTYPGVYIEEIPSGVRTIIGVATSITAIIGRTLRGPVNEPVTVNSFGDFERMFGGLWMASPLTYAVRDFFQNGGGQAIVVRLFKADNARSKALVRLTDTIILEAIHEGAWGNNLRATLNPEVREAYGGLAPADLFNLTIREGENEETFINLSFQEGPRRIDRVLKTSSNLVRWSGADLDDQDALPPIPAAEINDSVSLKESNLAKLEAELKVLMQQLQLLNQELAALEATEEPDESAIEAKQGEIEAKGGEIETKNQAITQARQELTAAKQAVGATDGQGLAPADFIGDQAQKTGLYALEDADLFNLLCIPPDGRNGDREDTAPEVYQTALAYCVKRRAMLIVDPKVSWGKAPAIGAPQANSWLSELGLFGVDARNAALYFPRVIQADPLRDGQPDIFIPCGMVAGIMARTDAQRGVWKAPAGLDAGLNGPQDLQVNLTDAENGDLNQRGINCLRTFPVTGRVVWGARTVRGADQLADEYKYVPIRRLALFIEESLFRGTQWVVFEPNDEPLWAQIRLNVGAFMHNLFRQGAFQGSSPRVAYFVKCDAETNPQYDIDRGIVNIHVGFAPLKPAEFVIIKIQQITKQLEV